jgi:hypothetical protein
MSPGNVSTSSGFSTSWNGPSRNAAPISDAAADGEGYTSPNQTGVAVNPLEEERNLSEIRGSLTPDEDVHKLLSWSTRKDYRTFIGIALPIKDWVGENYHAIQFWEEATEPIIGLENPATEMYNRLIDRFSGRARNLFIPDALPGSFVDVSVTTSRSGNASYILFEPDDNFAGRPSEMPIKVRISYNNGYTIIGMGDRYTLQMLATEFWTLTHNAWDMFPLPS